MFYSINRLANHLVIDHEIASTMHENENLTGYRLGVWLKYARRELKYAQRELKYARRELKYTQRELTYARQALKYTRRELTYARRELNSLM